MKDNIVFITGATSGIGKACAYKFAQHGARVVLCGRNSEQLKFISEDLAKLYGISCLPVSLDVRRKEEVVDVVGKLPQGWRNISILVNNAGLARGLSKIFDAEVNDWEEMIDTNLKGLLYVTRAITPIMLQQGKGQIINIGSIAGHEVYPNGNVYCATKHAVAALTKGMRLDLHGTGIRVSTVDPGMVETEFSVTRFRGDRERAKKVYEGTAPLKAEDVAECVYFCASQPSHVNISEIVVMPTAQSSVTMVARGGVLPKP